MASGASGALRAADDDRRRAADRLRAALADGRLTLPEYDERVRDAFAARTYGELNALVADLPVEAEPEIRAAAVRMPYAFGVLWTIWAVVLSINVTCWVLASVANHRLLYPWPVWVAAPTGAALLIGTLGARAVRRLRD